MTFTSREFAVLFLFVFAANWLLRRTTSPRVLLLLAASYLFYGWWDVRFLFLVVLSTAIDFSAALVIQNGRVSLLHRAFVWASVLGCAGVFVLPDWSGFSWPTSIEQLFANGPPGTTEIGRNVFVASLVGLVLFEAALVLATRLRDSLRRRLGLLASLVANLGLLGFFKYWNFFAAEFSAAFGVASDTLLLQIVLPVGISFYTFQTLSYTIDVFRGSLRAEESFSRFALFVAFFPQLVAGPIVRASHFLPQIARTPSLRVDDFERGLLLIFWGLTKKVVLADQIGGALVDPFWSAPESFGGWASALAIVGYAFQIYGDFSGYSDIALGSARLLGFDLGLNFNSPYRASSPSEFWTRWHISLSSWLRDYLYIPLGGNRRGPVRTYVNLVVTMLLGGLWHGAAWNFVVWGAYHGALLVGARAAGVTSEPATAVALWLRRGCMFVLVCVGWVFFRSPDLDSARDVFASLFAARGNAAVEPAILGLIALAFVTHFPPRAVKERVRTLFLQVPAVVRGAGYAALIGLVMHIQSTPRPFIYFQF